MSVTSTMAIDPLLDSSISSLKKKTSKEISRTYKEASALYLTRRLAEALLTIEPLLTPQHLEEESLVEGGAQHKEPALISTASRRSRVKVWCFYLTLLNAIVELGAEDGAEAFGDKQWRNIVAKAQDGSIWDEVVEIGYGGVEGKVDAEVVLNLANLLLAQSTSQQSNQDHVEIFLSTAGQSSVALGDSHAAKSKGTNRDIPSNNDITSLRDLEYRLQIIEIYALHILPRNEEWEYARDFISMSDILEEETREGFLQTLKNLEEDQKGTKPLKELEPMYEPETLIEDSMAESSTSSTDTASTVREVLPNRNHARSESEKDYGVETSNPLSPLQSTTNMRTTKEMKTSFNPTQAQKSHAPPARPPSNTLPRRPAGGTSVYKRSLGVINVVQNLSAYLSTYISQNPLGLLRFLLFLMGIIAALSRQGVKDRLSVAWKKLRRTIGMGVRVTYI